MRSFAFNIAYWILSIGYGLTAFGPSFMQRSLGMGMIQVAWIVAPVAGVMGTLSALGGGWLANRVAKRWGLYAQAWLVLALYYTMIRARRCTVALPFWALVQTMLRSTGLCSWACRMQKIVVAKSWKSTLTQSSLSARYKAVTR